MTRAAPAIGFRPLPEPHQRLRTVCVAAMSMGDADLVSVSRGRLGEMLAPDAALGDGDAVADKLASWKSSPGDLSNLEREALAYVEQFGTDIAGISDKDNQLLADQLSTPGWFNFVQAINMLEAHLRVSAFLGLDSATLESSHSRVPHGPSASAWDRPPASGAAELEAYRLRVTDPLFLELFGEFSRSVHRLRALDDRSSEMLRLRNAMHQQCAYCMSFRREAEPLESVDDLAGAVARYETSSLDERDKAILRLADGFLSYPSEIGDATWASAAEVLSTSEIAEIPYKLASWMQDKSRIALRYDGAFDPDRLTRFRYDEYGRWALTSAG